MRLPLLTMLTLGNFSVALQKCTSSPTNILHASKEVESCQVLVNTKGWVHFSLDLSPTSDKVERRLPSKHCQRRHMYLYSQHMRSCPQQPYTCPYCRQYSSTYENVTSTHLSECGDFPVQCKLCLMKLTRKNLQHHISNCVGGQNSSQSEQCLYLISLIKT